MEMIRSGILMEADIADMYAIAGIKQVAPELLLLLAASK